MTSRSVIALAFSVGLSLYTPTLAAEFGTAEEARAMLGRAVAEVQADRDAAIEMFNTADGDYRDRDLYVFCFNADDGITTAHAFQSEIGEDVRELRDDTGKAMGQEMVETAQDGTVSEISYTWPRPGETEPAAKRSYYTRIGEDICGVGYYE